MNNSMNVNMNLNNSQNNCVTLYDCFMYNKKQIVLHGKIKIIAICVNNCMIIYIHLIYIQV